MIRFAIFVDGSNLYGCLRDMNLRVDDYQVFYRHIFDEAVETWKDTGAVSLLSKLDEIAVGLSRNPS